MENKKERLSNNLRLCRAITNDGNPCQNRALRNANFCFQHYPKRPILSQFVALVLGAVMGVGATQFYDITTLSSEETLLIEQRDTIKELEDRNSLLERQLEELGKYVQTTPEGSVIIGKPTGGKIEVTPGSSLTISPHPAFSCNQAWNYIQENKLNAARELLEESLSADNTYYRAHLYFGLVLMIEGDFTNALIHIENAITHAPKGATEKSIVLLTAGLAYKGVGSREQALEYFQKALILDPHYSLAKRAIREIDDEIEVPFGKAVLKVP